jgi:type I restriction enzyme R subunit
MSTDLSEKALETLIVKHMTSSEGGWVASNANDYDREYAVDLAQLTVFLRCTQPDTAEALDLDHEGTARRKFLARLQGEVTKRGVIDVLRKGL